MLHKIVQIIKALAVFRLAGESEITRGKIAKYTGYSYSSVKRAIEIAKHRGLMSEEIAEYKSTGKYVFAVTQKGHDLMLSQLEMKL